MIFKSPHPAISIPNITISEFVLQHAEKHGSKSALIEGTSGRSISYEHLRSSIRSLAAGFAREGVSKSDVFAIYCPNIPEYVLAFHAVTSLGAVATMVPTLLTSAEVATQLQDSKARYLLTTPPLMERARSAAESAQIEKVFVIGEAEGAIPFSSLMSDNDSIPEVTLQPDVDIAALPYSSGTTGFPKGVMLTHRNLVAMLCQMNATAPLNETDTMICVVPMYHLYGLHVVANLALTNGATVVTLPRFELSEFLKALEQYRVTVAPLVPPLVLTLSRSPEVDNYDLSRLRLIHCGAASLSDDVARACTLRLGCEIRYGYGLTEVSPLSHLTADSAAHRPGSVGHCLPNTECRIVDYTNGHELGANEEGEIWIRGPQVMKGYLGNPTATAEMLDAEGWLRTGDVGYVDEDGQLFVVDRVKELIKYKGRQVAPAELEAVLLSHPQIADAAVIPSQDEEAGEVPKAFVVLHPESVAEINAQEIMEFVAQRVAPHKRIRKLEFVTEIPKSLAGKILRRVLIEKEREGK
jgi:acyl-CoA synthetase (AMP-forming)/AMP-acid ligase II